MAAFASCRRSGWVRVLVVILCALFIFAMIGTPPAYAVGETVALFGAAAVLSSAVAALGFKLSNDSDGIATLNKMVSDFAKEAWALNVLVVGNRINGLIDGMNYIKMAVHNGKTYLDERVVAWCQQWLANNGVYDVGGVSYNDISSSSSSQSLILSFVPYSVSVDLVSSVSVGRLPYSYTVDKIKARFSSLVSHFNLSLDNSYCQVRVNVNRNIANTPQVDIYLFNISTFDFSSPITVVYKSERFAWFYPSSISAHVYSYDSFNNYSDRVSSIYPFVGEGPNYVYDAISSFCTSVLISSNDTGLSGTDTIGEDYKDKTLDQILDGLKDWAQDWYDAGVDSATNAATGAIDLPVTVGDQAATANPALNPDVVYNPPFSIPWPGVRSGETSSGAISDGKANVDAAETATTDVAENQSVIDSLVNWALNYINPDTGLFSKFPLCVPYDAYLLVTSSLGVDAVGSDSIFGASPGDLDGVVSQDIETYSDFQPIINIKHDFELDGTTYPLELVIDLTPWQPLVTFFREGMALLLVAELIGAEFKRIRGH